ncbi:hypothetical protein CTAYLR_010762 [Chrysophaeum taylorii]|uniref:ATP phosphoribosyltransferase n=1 Tax=Chrysophaeum taylorii TaxID=2483200 RepID=A0AAD7U5W7_9STRA|nr:hypothetical protein CTAYLR_010762 [Chrysophaeum taylorii]
MQRSAWVVRGAAATSVSAAWCHSTEDESVVLPQRWRHSHPTNGERPHLLFGVPKKDGCTSGWSGCFRAQGSSTGEPSASTSRDARTCRCRWFFCPADIAKYVGEGEVDIGITGEDILAESDVEVDVLLKLGIGKCRLSVQAPVGKFKSSEELAGKRIATSFPRLAGRHFAALESGSKEPTKIKVISGSVEAACGLGLADAVVDLVETGTTMKAAGLERSPSSCTPRPSRIAGYLTATTWVMCTYNVHRENLERCKTITPGKKSPSISPLERGDWVAVSALVPKKHAPAVMDELEAAGATDILPGLVGSRMGD